MNILMQIMQIYFFKVSIFTKIAKAYQQQFENSLPFDLDIRKRLVYLLLFTCQTFSV